MKLRNTFIRFISLAGLLFLSVSFVSPAQAKEIWLNPVEAGKKTLGNWGGVKFKKSVHFQWRVPEDFDVSSPQSGNATLLVVGMKTQELNYQVNVNVVNIIDDVGLSDANLTSISPETGLLPVPLTKGTLTEIPLTGALPNNLIPGDYVTLSFERAGKKKVKALILGLRYDYASIAITPADISALQAAIAVLQAAIAVLQAENASQMIDITALQTANTTQGSAITALQTVQGTQNTNIASLQAVNGTQTTDITALQTANTTQDSAITALQTEQGVQNSNIASLQAVNGTQTTDITALQGQYQLGLNELTALQTEQGTQNGSISTLQANVSTLQTDTGNLLTTFAGVTRTGNDIFFDSVNVYVRDGSGATDGLPGAGTAAPNGLGNLIVGYDEDRTTGSDKTGSHNLVVGEQHNYSSYGGLVVGFRNTVSGPSASVSGGFSNTASGGWSSVSGGGGNDASGSSSSVSGGWSNTANGGWSSVSGGAYRSTTGFDDWVAGSLFEDQ